MVSIGRVVAIVSIIMVAAMCFATSALAGVSPQPKFSERAKRLLFTSGTTKIETTGKSTFQIGSDEESAMEALIASNMPASYIDPFGPTPIYVSEVRRLRRDSTLGSHLYEVLDPGRGAPPLEEGEIEEEQEIVFCQGGARFTLRTRAFIRQDEVQIVYVTIDDGAPETIRSIAVTPATDWNIKENRCNINYARNGDSCSNLMVEFTQVPNGTHRGTVTLTLNRGELTYTRTLTD